MYWDSNKYNHDNIRDLLVESIKNLNDAKIHIRDQIDKNVKNKTFSKEEFELLTKVTDSIANCAHSYYKICSI